VAKQAITMTKNFDLKKINLDLTKELNQAGRIIRTDHFKRLDRGQGVSGPMIPSQKTSGKTLVKSGKMRKLVIDEATKMNQEVVIHPGEKQTYKDTDVTMSDVGGFHQFGAGNLPVREWFGITKKAEKRIVKMMELEIEREIKRA
jgi:phage gpG-like protein